ncbi:uncharacterized protein IUM83_01315 [Phytophthora cinnamomi]|uniref:uncharacterized protein n=1 Tax=Phytophthora cinnamomi TaxID=4785 RepID=UPI003559ADA6|nr:putative membrane protein [Phytophthora cinnamomi]
MLFWRDKLFGSAFSSHPSGIDTSRRGFMLLVSSVIPKYKLVRHLWEDLTGFEGKNRKSWNALLKLVDIAFETGMLRQLLQNGSPTSLTYGFAGFIAVNALSCVINVLTDRFSALTEVFISSIFDLAAAVLFPIGVLIYCYHNFDFDREVYYTYLEKLPPGSFERLARSFASPSNIALFRVNFDSLRISSIPKKALGILVYVDDVLIGYDITEEKKELMSALHEKYDIKDLGELLWFLDMRVTRVGKE